MKKKNIVIIGAGPAGLTAAYELLKRTNKYNVIILEKDCQVGGISKTVEFDGYRVDTGIHRFFSKSSRVNEIWNEILKVQNKPSYDDKLLKKQREYLKDGSDPEVTDKSMLIRDRLTRIYFDDNFFSYPVSINIELIKNLGMFRILKAGFSYLKSCIFKRKENSLEDFYINRFGKYLYSIFFENYTEKVWGVHPSNISADWGAQRVKGISIFAVIKDAMLKIFRLKNNKNTETSLIESFYYPKLGAGQIWEEMANKIEDMGGSIKLNCNVKNIYINNSNISKIVYMQYDKEEYAECDICISSMPIKDLINGIRGLNIDRNIKDIALDLPYREFMSVGLVVDKLKLVNNTDIKTINNVIPDSWIYVQEQEAYMGRLQVFNNWSPYLFNDKNDIKKEVLVTLEYFCSENDRYWNMSDEEFIDFAINDAIKVNIIDSKEDIKHSCRIKIEKAYPAYFGTYKDFEKVKEFLDSIDNLYCIGRNGQHRYNNMDHSMLTGINTAENIINNIDLKENIWNVNTEKEYHEIKK